MSSFLQQVQFSIGHTFNRPELLRQALTHRSFSSDHYERLEFLGDSILNMLIAQLLFERFPALREGELSRVRAMLVKQEALAEIASRLNLGAALRLGEGELRSGGYSRPSILADALEATLGAVYLDAGFLVVKTVVEKLYAELLNALNPSASLKDPKTTLQELLQARRLPLPTYKMVKVTGEAHAQFFEVECLVPLLHLSGIGQGSSRRVAEQLAATKVLEQVGSTREQES